MSAPTTKNRTRTVTETSAKSAATDQTGFVDVLYQRMGDRWYAFSLVDDEVFFAPVDQELIDNGTIQPMSERNGIDRKGNA